MNLNIRPRRLRVSPPIRALLQRVEVRKRDIIVPVFVTNGKGVISLIPSMPGVNRMSVDVAADWLDARGAEGYLSCILFGVVDASLKDPVGSEALNPGNSVCRLLRELKKRKNPMVAMTDLCFCEYTDHGHCGPMKKDGSTVDNDEALEKLALQALSHAKSGADVIAPSGMMDGVVGVLRKNLDDAGFIDVAILAYSVKYVSAFYGPFRDAANSAPAFGDRRSYQMDPARDADEAILEIALDIEQGADMVMVKPAMAYLDILKAVREKVNVPVVAYQVSGEYAMLLAAINNGWLDKQRAILESLTSIKRAGADLIISYFAQTIAGWIER
jgi:porphobilinogen synthase